jgi:hypothetical protein
MQRPWTILAIVMLAACFAPAAFAAGDRCAVCNKEISGTVYTIKDEITGEQKMVCSNCVVLPRCFRCGLPVNEDGLALPDGRHLCPRDAKIAVLDVDVARRIYEEAHDDLDRVFARFTSFPTNVDVLIIDRVDVDTEFDNIGHTYESPDVLGWMVTKTNANEKRFKIGLLSGLPAEHLKAISAHELSHTWVAVNVAHERHARLGRDAEEGFCEMVAYLLMEAEHEEVQEKYILRNAYTRGQVQLFIEAEKRYGFDEVLDWMKSGKAAQLRPDHPEDIRDIETLVGSSVVETPIANHLVAEHHLNSSGANSSSLAPVSKSAETNLPLVAPSSTPEPAKLKLQGILWGNPPSAIINGHTIFAKDRFKLKIGGVEMTFRCLEIRKNSVRIENVDSGKQSELSF